VCRLQQSGNDGESTEATERAHDLEAVAGSSAGERLNGGGGVGARASSVASGSGHATSADSGCSTASWLGESRDREWVGGVVGVATRHLGLTGAKGLVEHGSVLGGGEDGHESREDEGEELHLD